MAYNPLPITEVAIADLHLDLENYRIPSKPEDQAGALKYLFASEEVLEAATLILRDGYFDNEVPIVTKDSESTYVVLEGNRRVSALKALHDPQLVPGHAPEVERLLKRYATEAANLPKSIRVLVTPDRDSARPHIARLHTGLAKRRWSRDQQATFYFSLLDGETSVDDLKLDYPGVNIVRFIKMAVVRRFLVGAKFSDPSLREFVRGDALRMSSFEYAYRRNGIAEAIGTVFDRDGQLLPRGESPEQVAESLSPGKLAALEYLVGEFRAQRINTRSPELKANTPEHDALVSELVALSTGDAPSSVPPKPEPANAPDSAPSNAETASATEAPNEAPTPPDAASRGPNHPDSKVRLDLTGLDYSRTPVNLKQRYHELREIRYKVAPVTTAILLRSILEMTIKWHFSLTPTPATGMLNEVFKSVASTYGSDKALRNTINAVNSGGLGKPGSIAWLNAAAHDFNVVVPASEVQQAWKQVSPLLIRLLAPPETRS